MSQGALDMLRELPLQDVKPAQLPGLLADPGEWAFFGLSGFCLSFAGSGSGLRLGFGSGLALIRVWMCGTRLGWMMRWG